MKKNKKFLGEQVFQAREQLGEISQQDLADLIESSQSEVSRWERKADQLIPKRFAERIRQLLHRSKLGLPLLPSKEELIEYFPPRHAPPGLPRIFAAFQRPKPARGQPKVAPLPQVQSEPPPPPPAGVASLVPMLRQAIAICWASSVAASVLFMSCIAHTTGVSPALAGVHNLIYPDDAQEEAQAENGSIPIPSEPYPGQKRAPCDVKKGEAQKVGGCWAPTDLHTPCPNYTVEDAGKCLMPIPAEPKRPSTVTPEQ